MNNIDFQKGYELSMKHVSYLIQDADSLANKGSFGHAFFLYFTAMEEAVKAFHYAMAYCGLIQYDNKTRKDLSDHGSKMAISFGIYSSQRVPKVKVEPKSVSSRELIESVKELGESLEEFRKLRERSLYVDHTNNDWSNPMDFPKSEFFSFKEIVIDFVSWVSDYSSKLFVIPKNQIEESLKPFALLIVQLRLYTNMRLFEDNYITKEIYERNNTKLQRQIKEMLKGDYKSFWNDLFNS